MKMEIQRLTNKQKIESLIAEIVSMGFHIRYFKTGNYYFLFEGEDNSICHFEIKEIPGFLFAFWSTDRFDTYEYQYKHYGKGRTWADSLEIDHRSEIVFFTQYKRDLDKFKPSRSGFCLGLHREVWQEGNKEETGVHAVEKWVEIDALNNILKYMKKHHFKSVEYVGLQRRYIWEDNISGFKAFRQFINDWCYELRYRFKKYIKLRHIKRKSKKLLKKIKLSYGIVIDRGNGWSPRIEIIIRRKELDIDKVNITKYIKEQNKIDKFENKYWNGISLIQYDLDITEDDLTEDEIKADRDEFVRFKEYISGLGKDEKTIIFRNYKGEL